MISPDKDRGDLSLAGCLRNALRGNRYTEMMNVLTNRTFQRKMKLSEKIPEESTEIKYL